MFTYQSETHPKPERNLVGTTQGGLDLNHVVAYANEFSTLNIYLDNGLHIMFTDRVIITVLVDALNELFNMEDGTDV